MSEVTWDSDTYDDVELVVVVDSNGFVKLLNDNLSEGYQFLTEEECSEGVPEGKGWKLSNSLLGSISEYALYVLKRIECDVDHPFIACFRFPDPLGKGNFPLIDIRFFGLGSTPAEDSIKVIEIKTTRSDANYFKKTLEDFAGLYDKGRLVSTVEHLKADLIYAGRSDLIPRVNDCIGVCESDSEKIHLFPTGISCDSCDEDECVYTLQGIVTQLRQEGWPLVSATHLRVPEIEETYLSFAIGTGDV